MANYHLSIKVFSRGKGASAVQKAAYRAAECLTSDYDKQTHDYTRKRGIVHTEIILPDHAPAEYADRAVLWNAVEQAEAMKNAQLAREVEISLPVELTREQNIVLAHEFVKRTFVDKGMCADVCVHDKNDGNPHAHIMLTMRPLEPDGTWGAKSRKEYILDRNGNRMKLKSGEFKTRKINAVDWNDQTKADEWRVAWEESQNAALAQYGHSQRVDHRSYKKQGKEQIPTVHLGVAVHQMERRGLRTELGDKNREIAVTNQKLGQLRARIKKLKDWAYAQPIQDAPTLPQMMDAINKGQNLNSRWKKLNDLQTRAKILIFMQQYDVYDMEQLVGAITKIHTRRHDLAGQIKSDERRLTTLNKHLAQTEILKQHKEIYRKYKQLDPKKRGAYAEKYAEELAAHKAATTYLKEHLNGHTSIPEKAWRVEREKLLAARYARCDEYYKLKDNVRMVEVLRRGAENIMQEIPPERTPTRARDMSL